MNLTVLGEERKIHVILLITSEKDNFMKSLFNFNILKKLTELPKFVISA